MHTIKGSSAMMFFDNISTLAHSIEDLFFFIRDEKPKIIDYHSLSDLLLQTIDFIKIEINKIKEGHSADGDTEGLIALVSKNLERLKQKNSISNLAPGNEIDMGKEQQYSVGKKNGVVHHSKNAFEATIFFEDGCQMENIRAYVIVHNLKNITEELFYIPEDIAYNNDSVSQIREEGFKILLKQIKAMRKSTSFFWKLCFLKILNLKG